MTKNELLTALNNGYLDDLGLVKPHKADGESDNGVLWTTDAQVLTNSDFQEEVIQDCYLKPGLLARKPRSVSSNQEQKKRIYTGLTKWGRILRKDKSYVNSYHKL